MPDLDLLFPGRFLKGTQLSGVTKVEILGSNLENLADEDDGSTKQKKRKADHKAVLTVKMRDPVTCVIGPREIVWCKVNALLTAEIYGRNTDEWIGKTLFIWHDERVKFGKNQIGGIRVCGAPASVLPTERPVVIRLKKKVGGDLIEEHTLRPNGGLTAPKSPGHAAPTTTADG